VTNPNCADVTATGRRALRHEGAMVLGMASAAWRHLD
jgi:hypothetical protein